MGIQAVSVSYQARLIALQATASQLRLGQVIAFAVMCLAITAILLLAFLSLARHRIPWPWIPAPVPLAIFAGTIGRKRNAALLRARRLQTYYEGGMARLAGHWAGSGVQGHQFAPPEHSYAQDLQIFGEGSLFELLCTCRTEIGRRRLADYLLNPTMLSETLRRQEAVRELQNKSHLREQIHVLGEYAFQQSTWETLAGWLDSPVSPASSSTRVLTLITSTALAFLFLLGWSHAMAWSALTSWMGGLLLISGVLGLLYRTDVLASLPAIRAVGTELSVLRQGLKLLQGQTFRATLLTELVEASRQGDPPARLRQLERRIKAMAQKDKEWFYLGSRALLIGTQVFLAIENWRRNHAAALRRWLSVWGEFEALMALAQYADEHPDSIFPQFSETETMLEGQGLAHPLLPTGQCVRNDILFNQRTRFYVISGSNMAGKSTILRAIGLNAVLAYAGAPVCAESLMLSHFQICASLAVQDSLLEGKSKFLAEMDRLKQALTIPAEQGPVLFLIDEILSGTNSKDRRAAAEAIMRELLRRGAVGAMSTHDLALTELATLKDLPGANRHMGSRSDADPLNFDYLLKPGITRQSSALAIARLAGVPI